jgi:hypothetical protein
MLDEQPLAGVGQRLALDDATGADAGHEARQRAVVRDRLPHRLCIGVEIEHRLGLEPAAAAADLHLHWVTHPDPRGLR